MVMEARSDWHRRSPNGLQYPSIAPLDDWSFLHIRGAVFELVGRETWLACSNQTPAPGVQRGEGDIEVSACRRKTASRARSRNGAKGNPPQSHPLPGTLSGQRHIAQVHVSSPVPTICPQQKPYQLVSLNATQGHSTAQACGHFPGCPIRNVVTRPPPPPPLDGRFPRISGRPCRISGEVAS
ncbi:hypothetical protein LZ30DRAFT_351860 [Colletotrichum cereale]|nr:hypothetical protein LZ30DRAFT_351860 [Colletotrichum cereale]